MKQLLLFLTSFILSCTPPSTTNGGFDIVITGEGAATEGIAFPAAVDGEPFFQDGWSLSFTNVVVFVGDIGISENPDRSPGDQSQTGDLVVKADGPFVADLAKPGPVTSKEQNGTAWPVTTLSSATIDPTQKYAFGYTLKTASANAKNVNEVDDATIAAMVAKGWSVWVKGVAEFKGTSCRSSDASYDFNRVPKKVNFEFGYAMPTIYKNCINPELQPEESRGIQAIAGQNVTAQITFHLDHQFWEALQEDAPLRFDLIAARKSVAVGMTAPGEVSVTRDDLVGVDFQAGTDAQGQPLPWRSCAAPDASDHTTGAVSYDPQGVPVSAAGGAAGLKDLADYITYNLSTFGHLNNDGLCFPQREFAAPQ